MAIKFNFSASPLQTLMRAIMTVACLSSPALAANITISGVTCPAVSSSVDANTGNVSVACSSSTTAPAAPIITSIVAGNAQAQVLFTKGASGGEPSSYAARCYGGTGGNYSNAVLGATSPIIVTGLINDSTYTCELTATNSAGTSPATLASTRKFQPNATQALYAPGAPTIGTVTPSANAATIAYTAPSTGASVPAITRYDVSCTPTQISGGTNTTANPIPLGLTDGVTYVCSLAATNSIGTGPASAAVTIRPPTGPSVPAAPTAQLTSNGNGSATLTITPGATNGATIDSYTVNCNDGTHQFSVTSATSPIMVTGLTNGTSYTCTAVAHNSEGNSALSSPVTAAPQSGQPPSQPQTVTAAISSASSVQLGYTAPASAGDAAIANYRATCNPGSHTAQTGNGTVAALTVTGLTPDTAYTCSVAAYNTYGWGSEGTASGTYTPKTPTVPAAPTIGFASAGTESVTVPFTAPTNTGLSYTGAAAAITGYTANCASSDGGLPGNASGTGGATSINVPNLTGGKKYMCRVTATNATGTSPESGDSNEVTAALATSCGSVSNVTTINTQVVAAAYPQTTHSPAAGATITAFKFATDGTAHTGRWTVAKTATSNGYKTMVITANCPFGATGATSVANCSAAALQSGAIDYKANVSGATGCVLNPSATYYVNVISKYPASATSYNCTSTTTCAFTMVGY
jgi:hypothetical protein